ncbi:Hint domain-containing protein [Albidovulum sp.]|uniref:Hint domain-containing protein n=1 Tax=Albidovulum sp. TaxID=1872424 RepID=UPI003527E74E
MGAPNIVGTSTGDVTEGSGAIVSGDLDDSNPFFANDNWSISVAASYGTATINPTTGVWSYDLNDTHPAVVALNLGDTLTDTFTVRLSDSGGSDTQVVTITIHGVPCFSGGTRILTPQGERAVEDLAVGDLVVTRDHGPQPVLWLGSRTVPAEGDLAPIRIAAGVHGNRRDLIVSPQHRIVVAGWEAELHYGRAEVLVAAKHLLDGARVTRLPGGEVTYYHVMFDRHEVIFAEGAATESFFAGGDAAVAMAEVEAELHRIFAGGHGKDQRQTARHVVSRHEAAVLRDGARDRRGAVRPGKG